MKHTTMLSKIAAITATGTFASVVAAFNPAGWTCKGTCGELGADGVVTLAPGGGSQYGYVTTSNGVSGVALVGIGGVGSATVGSTLRSPLFAANAGDPLSFSFNYVTADGAGYSDYGWARLLDGTGNQVALLFTARTTTSGNTVPGFAMPLPAATLVPATTPIVSVAPNWAPLGIYSGLCFASGCGYTGWIKATYTIPSSGNFRLEFGTVNWNDGNWPSGMAFDGAIVASTPIGAVPIPAADMVPSLAGMPTTAQIGVPYSGTYTCTNAAPVATAPASIGATCAISSLPAGLTASCNPPGPSTGTVAVGAAITCTVTGTPTAAGVVPLTLQTGAANDVDGGAVGKAGNNQVTGSIAVTGSDMAPAITSLPPGTVGLPYSGTYTCTNGTATATAPASIGTTCAIAGLPTGLTSSCGPTVPTVGTVGIGAVITCTVSGTPSASATSPVTVTTGAINDLNGGTTASGNNSATGLIVIAPAEPPRQVPLGPIWPLIAAIGLLGLACTSRTSVGLSGVWGGVTRRSAFASFVRSTRLCFSRSGVRIAGVVLVLAVAQFLAGCGSSTDNEATAVRIADQWFDAHIEDVSGKVAALASKEYAWAG